MNFFRNLLIFADAGNLVNITTNGSTGPVNAYTGAHNAALASDNSMSPGMKTYYDTELLENARPKLIFTQLGKMQDLPANHGDNVEWRKWNTFPKATTPLQEAVIPVGKPFGQTKLSVQVKQYGDYTTVSDVLEVHHIDNVILGATEEMGAAGGWTADTLVRNELCTGTSVIYADTLDANGVPTATPVGRYQMAANNNRLTPDAVNKAYTFLKKQKAPYFEGNKYVAVIHPSVSYDLRSSTDWLEVHKYAATKEIFEGEIGELHGVRFIETTEAPIFKGDSLFSSSQDYLTLSAYTASGGSGAPDFGITSVNMATVSETITDAIGAALIGRKVNYYDASATAVIGTATIVGVKKTGGLIFLDKDETFSVTYASDDKLYPGEGASDTSGAAVYGTMFFGKDAFGVVDPEKMGMEMIIKSRSEIGGPLEQFSTVGYKFETATKILYENRMVRVESCSAYSGVDEAN